MNIDKQIEWIESELRHIYYYNRLPSSSRVVHGGIVDKCSKQPEAILKTLKEVKADRKIEDLCN